MLRKSFDTGKPPELVMFAGLVAGVAEITTTYPLDTVKTHLQVYPGKYRGISDACIKLVRSGGPFVLFNGLPASIAQVGGKVSLRFTVFDRLRESLRHTDGTVTPMSNLVAGCSAGALEAIVWTTPTERIKILQQNNVSATSPTVFRCIRDVVREQGLKGLFVGVVPTIYKQSASVGTRFWLYNLTRDYFVSPGSTPKVWQTLTTGAVVGGLSTVLNHPFDVVKSRMQVETHNRRFTGTFQGLKLIAKEDGLPAVMKGLSPRFLRVAFAQAITFSVYEAMISFFS